MTMKKLLIMLLLSAFAAMSVVGCGGRAANPIATKEVGDRDLDCDDIEAEMSDLDAQARRLLGEQDNKTGKNVAIGLAGLVHYMAYMVLCRPVNCRKAGSAGNARPRAPLATACKKKGLRLLTRPSSHNPSKPQLLNNCGLLYLAVIPRKRKSNHRAGGVGGFGVVVFSKKSSRFSPKRNAIGPLISTEE